LIRDPSSQGQFISLQRSVIQFYYDIITKKAMLNFIKKHCKYFYLGIVLLVSLSIYMPYYGQPNALFWDENYHIASAQKHIDGIMYMEPHPPLGKMLMALSEKMLGLNDHLDKSAFTKTDYIKGDQVPKGMSFYGFRLPSTLLAALSVLFFFGIVNRITGNLHLAGAFSLIYILDNALVIHSRAAMLEGIQMFFMLAAIYFSARAITAERKIQLKDYALVGLFVGLGIAVKINAAILLLLFVVMYCADQWENIKQWNYQELLKRLATSVPSAVLPIVGVIMVVFYVHIGFGKTLTHNTYTASPEFVERIREGRTFNLATFFIGLKDNLVTIPHYEAGVPKLDVCKDGENGSYPLSWPVGNKTISYRWNKFTEQGVTKVQYHNIVPNPVIWFSVLAGIVLSVGLVISHVIYRNPIAHPKLFFWISGFTSLYISYMIAMLNIERVMYIYHYLIPLVFGLINLSLVYNYIFHDSLAAQNRHAMINLAGFVLLVAFAFYIFSPFTYSIALTETEFGLRNWFEFWKLEVVR